MLALIPIIGVPLAIMTIAGEEAIRLGLLITGHPIEFATAQMIEFAVFVLAL